MTEAVDPYEPSDAPGRIIPHGVVIDISKNIRHDTLFIASGEDMTTTRISQLNGFLANAGVAPITAGEGLVAFPVNADPAAVARALTRAAAQGAPKVELYLPADFAGDDDGAVETGRIIPHPPPGGTTGAA